MGRIRHIAIATRELEATTRFYIEGLGLKQVGKINTPTSEGYYLSDGHVNLAILKFKYDEPATTEGTLGTPASTISASKSKHGRGGTDRKGRRRAPSLPGTEEMAKRGNVEVKFSGPDGVTIDLSEHGWLALSKRLPGFKPAPTKLTAESRRTQSKEF